MSGGLPPDVRMANEIAIQFTHIPFEDAVERIAKHLRSFWDPRMRRSILEYVDRGGADLDPIAAAAVERLRQPA